MITTADIAAAAERIGPYVRRTELNISEAWSERHGATIVIKAEHTQHTGSFKLRGALNKVLGLDGSVRRAGIIAASSGNHGIATAAAAKTAGVACTVYLPNNASSSKVAAIRRLGAEIVTVGSGDAAQAEAEARATAETGGAIYVSPYNDPDIVAGQGTIAVEITEDGPLIGLESIDAVVMSVGGGGLISGMATWLAERSPSTVVVGASPVNDQAMIASIKAGSIVEPSTRATFSDGTAGGIETDAITFDLCRSLVDVWMSVTEDELAAAVAALIDDHHQVVEGAAGVALAAAGRYGRQHPGATIVVVTCGANVSSSTLHQMLSLSTLQA